METTTETKRKDVYHIVNERIIQQLEKGVVPWKKNWKDAGMPANLITENSYRGINVLLLASLGYSQNYFLTFKQVKELGAYVKDGEKPCPVIYWKKAEEETAKPDATVGGEKPAKPLLRFYNVYNIAQCKGIPENRIPALPKPSDPITSCEIIIDKMPLCPEVYHNGDEAYYSPDLDLVNIPQMRYFQDAEAYYETLFHELVHSTGHPTRLNRKELSGKASQNSESYSVEELIAEIGACYLKSHSGLEVRHFNNNVAYISGWLNVLKKDRRFIVYACARAQQAVDFILGMSQATPAKVEEKEAA